MIRSKIAMGFLWAMLALALHVVPGAVGPVHAQGTRKDDIVFNSRGIPLAGATVRVCAMPATGQPCTPLALIYSDAALTQALANPTTTDGLGNYFFYAAPGKYEIEISGPAITTKQIPNVILPNDPASPNFSAVSAFSLTLSGNLTVNGNTTVVGNLASGTLNLANQSTPPGSASSGTVNLYTKTADKRLYYKDDTGTEVGPVGAGAQTSTVNTFTANQNMDAGFHIKGPDPYSDVARYGGYANASPPSTTASCTNASTSVTLAAALDFQDATKFPGASIGNGIVIYQCGAATGLSTPPAPAVAPYGVTGGSTTYNYKYVAEDLSGGLTAASPAGTTTTGAATLGLNTINLTSATWNNTLNGQQVYTCSGNCNVSVNAPINVVGFTNAHFNGNYTIIATNGTNQFTVYSPTNPPPVVTSESASASFSILACNILTMPALAVPSTVEGASTDTVMRWWVYRNNALAFAVQQRDPYYEDCGVNTPTTNIPSYVPTTPGAAVNKYLATTIVSGGGTTSIVVANAAGNTISGQTALHDNSQNLLACMTVSKFNNPCYLSTTGPFNAATVFTGLNSGGGHLLLPYGAVLNQPWVERAGNLVFDGSRNQATSFQFNPAAQIVGGGGNSYALPTFLGLPLNNGTSSGTNPQTQSGVNFLNILFITNSGQGVAFNWDMNSQFGLMMDNVSFTGGGAAVAGSPSPVQIRGVTQSRIGRYGDQNSCGSAEVILGPPCFRFTTQSPAEQTSLATMTGSLGIYGFNVQGGGANYLFDVLPWINGGGNPSLTGGPGPVEIWWGLREIGKGPFLRLNAAGVNAAGTFSLKRLDDDAPNAQPGNAFIDLAASLGPSNIEVQDIKTSVQGQALVAGPAQVTVRGGNVAFGTISSGSSTNTSSLTTLSGGTVSTSMANGSGIQASDVTVVGHLMATPAAPTVVAGAHNSCASNCIAAGTWFYSITANDANGHNSPVSLATSITADGTQTITVSWTPIAGQVSTSRGRGTTATNGGFADNPGTGPAGTTSYIDSSLLFYSYSQPASSYGDNASLSSTGVAAQQLTLTNSGFPDTISSATLTASRTVTLPDANVTFPNIPGIVPTSGYQNSAYDNFNRANGAIGTNWSGNAGGFNVSGNVLVGTAALNIARYSALTFAASSAPGAGEFAQLTVVSPTTNVVAPAVFVGNSGVNLYACGENTTTLFLYKRVGGVFTSLNSVSVTGASGDLIRLEATVNGATATLNCFRNGASTPTLTATDTSFTSGSPGMETNDAVETLDNWSGGNFHPIAQLDSEQDWTLPQHFTQAVTVGATNPVAGTLPAGSLTAASYFTQSNCNMNSVSPAACGSAASGVVVVPTTTTTYTVNSNAVTASSRIQVWPITDNSGIAGSPTCNAPPTPFIGYESARVAGTSFTFTLPSTAGTSCWDFLIIN